MRLQVININGLKNIDNFGNNPFVIVYSQGIAKITYLPDYGETKIVTHQGRVKRVKFDEGEEF